jgi:hypothetical protein
MDWKLEGRRCMGTDSVGLFDKRFCDQILVLDGAGLAEFVCSRRKDFGEFSIFRFGFAPETSGTERVVEWMGQSMTLDALRLELVQELCFLSESLPVDSWGCFAEVFSSATPPGAISNLALFPQEEEERFLLLRPEHVAHMLQSLRAHRSELRIMSDSDLARLEAWREMCALDAGQMVAYFFDF